MGRGNVTWGVRGTSSGSRPGSSLCQALGGQGHQERRRPDCLCSSKEGLHNPPRHEAPEGSGHTSPVPSPLTTSRQDRGQGGGLSFILRPQQVETEEAAAVFPRVFPDGAGQEGRWGDGVGRQKAEAASQGSTGLGGFRPRPRTASCPRPSREAWEEGTDSLGWGWEERGASPFTSPALRAPASQNSGGHRQAHLSACLPSLLLFLLQGRPAPPHFKAQH